MQYKEILNKEKITTLKSELSRILNTITNLEQILEAKPDNKPSLQQCNNLQQSKAKLMMKIKKLEMEDEN